MDIRMPRMSGLECTRRLKAMVPGLVVVIVTMLDDPHWMSEASEAGADDYLIKPLRSGQCVATIQFALRRAGIANGPAARRLTDQAEQLTRPPSRFSALSARDQEVVLLIAEGLPDKRIADKLGLSEFIVHKHVHEILVKLGVSNRTQAASQCWDWTHDGR